MATRTQAFASATPWHLWLVGVLGLLWNGFGGYDYWMSQTAGETYLRSMGMTDPQIAYFNAMPAWMTAVWATGVWGAVVATVLLLMRSRWAVEVFAVSLAALMLSHVYTYLLSNGSEVMGTSVVVMNLVITAAAIFFLYYAATMRRKGVLR